ncbi:MAG: DNA polymerase I [Phycisphaerales bacterium JB058]
MSARPTLYIIDGYAQFFRAYHAIRTPMTSLVTGEPTNMTFGFVGMLLKLLRGQEARMQEVGGQPTYAAVALDVSGDRGTFRSQLYSEYKANRDAPPEDLRPQGDRCLAMLGELGMPVIGSEGYEADDVIAAISARLKEKHPDLLIRVISKDKDLKQLLEPGRFEIYDIHHDIVIDVDALKADTGLSPDQVVDMLTLMGDNVDNVPGVPGVGPKTAAQLLVEFGTLEAVLAEAQDETKPKKEWIIKGKRRENIAAAAGMLPLSKDLVTLRADTPIDFDLEACKLSKLQPKKIEPIIRELGFNRLLDEVKALTGGSSEPAAPAQTKGRSKAKDPGGFGGLFDQTPADDSTQSVDGDYTIVRTKKDLDALIKELKDAKAIALDTETTHIRPMLAKLAGLSFSTKPGTGWYVPVRAPEGEKHLDEFAVLEALRPIIEDETKPKLGHNLKYDLIVLRRAGVELRGLCTEGSCDTMVASYLIDASRPSHSLDNLALALLNRTNVSIKDLIGSGKNQKSFDQVPLAQAGPYAAEDADVSLQLAHIMLPELKEKNLLTLAHEVEFPLVEVLAELEYNGILVDPSELSRQHERLEGEIKRLRAEIEDAAYEALNRGFDPDSPKQLAGILFNKPTDEDPGLGLRVIKRGKTGPSTDAEVLEKLTQDTTVETKIPELVLDYRQLAKLVNTYLVNLAEEIHPETGRIHASFNQTVAATGRLSSSDPNLQNIPIRTDVGREIRKAFVAPEGCVLISADYSQIELRLLAHLSKDEALIRAFREGQDIHRAVAAQIHSVALDDVTKEQRSGAKMVNFGIVYGITPFGLARRLGVSNTEAAEIIDGYKKRFPGITTFLAECITEAQEQGYVETMLKRRRPVHEIDARNPARRALAERIAINSVVQGSAADLIKLAMIDLHRRIGPTSLSPPGRGPGRGDSVLAPSPLGGEGRGEGATGSKASPHPSASRPPSPQMGEGAEVPLPKNVRMLLQIHDELVFESPKDVADEAMKLIMTRMESAMELDVPLVVDAAASGNWFEGK